MNVRKLVAVLAASFVLAGSTRAGAVTPPSQPPTMMPPVVPPGVANVPSKPVAEPAQTPSTPAAAHPAATLPAPKAETAHAPTEHASTEHAEEKVPTRPAATLNVHPANPVSAAGTQNHAPATVPQGTKSLVATAAGAPATAALSPQALSVRQKVMQNVKTAWQKTKSVATAIANHPQRYHIAAAILAGLEIGGAIVLAMHGDIPDAISLVMAAAGTLGAGALLHRNLAAVDTVEQGVAAVDPKLAPLMSELEQAEAQVPATGPAAATKTATAAAAPAAAAGAGAGAVVAAKVPAAVSAPTVKVSTKPIVLNAPALADAHGSAYSGPFAIKPTPLAAVGDPSGAVTQRYGFQASYTDEKGFFKGAPTVTMGVEFEYHASTNGSAAGDVSHKKVVTITLVRGADGRYTGNSSPTDTVDLHQESGASSGEVVRSAKAWFFATGFPYESNFGANYPVTGINL